MVLGWKESLKTSEDVGVCYTIPLLAMPSRSDVRRTLSWRAGCRFSRDVRTVRGGAKVECGDLKRRWGLDGWKNHLGGGHR